jgi:hypothetical protein
MLYVRLCVYLVAIQMPTQCQKNLGSQGIQMGFKSPKGSDVARERQVAQPPQSSRMNALNERICFSVLLNKC